MVLLNVTVIKPIHVPTFVTPCGWNIGAETRRNGAQHEGHLMIFVSVYFT
jgi:hypothetical protein